MNYDYTDKVISIIDQRLITGFSRLKSMVSTDELNVIQEVNALYEESDRFVRSAYMGLANRVYAVNVRSGRKRVFDDDWLGFVLTSYDPVSKYVFEHEEDRKRARLIEAIMASDTKDKEVDAALRSLSFMFRIYAVRVTDLAVLQALLDDAEALVRWIAEEDNKTCSVCHTRDGKVYEIDRVPPKPHPNCRCRYERVL